MFTDEFREMSDLEVGVSGLINLCCIDPVG